MTLLHLIAVSLTLGGQLANAATAAVYDQYFNGIPDEEWENIFSTPNASSLVTFDGYDITKPYPANEPIPWRVSVKVKEGIPVDGPEPDSVVTGTYIQWGASPSLMVRNDTNNSWGLAPLHPSWDIVGTFIRPRTLTYEGEEVDPTCKGVLPDECISDYKFQLSTTYNKDNRGPNQSSFDRFSEIDPPKSCRDSGKFDSFLAYTMGFPQSTLNRTQERDDLFNFAKLTADSGSLSLTHRPGNFSDYDRTIRAVYMMAFVWGYSNLTEPIPEGTWPESTLVCFRASPVEGSRTLEEGMNKTEPGPDQGAGGNGNGGAGGAGGDESGVARVGAWSGLLLATLGAWVFVLL